MIETDSHIPSIVLAVPQKDEDLTNLSELLNGVEEEEIPLSVAVINEGDNVDNAYQAALHSKLAVGIAYDSQSVVLHYKNLQPREPLFTVPMQNNAQLRALGANAARLVKGTPFKLFKGSETE
ncbi:glycerol dehydratase reactivase beta/small subunit family protein [Secundilactobacillus silagei]|uniref:Propanediol dehydratase n=2 Tax=Secundilactobacillus silagei TaxID=1293415 RepID=A0A1Z5IGG2_9LACO|nr:glycerol dehydratase reactivase beta/small subunit family protein [Secundilactobacillus silagei]TDG72051.1 hypothetical protein C5L25_002435 [Secundilactobacillus silagei JCM 19001]GAX00511.1 propanediol dehydratase [Secundilactobacillus silagei JCM 19001]